MALSPIVPPPPSPFTAGPSGAVAAADCAREFSCLLVEQLVSAMRRAAQMGSTSSMGMETFERMMDEHVARALASQDSFGLAAQLGRELRNDRGAASAPPPPPKNDEKLTPPPQVFGSPDDTRGHRR